MRVSAKVDYALRAMTELAATCSQRTTPSKSIERLVVVGADTRIELVDGSGERMTARLRRDDVEHLELMPGEIVWATPEHSRSVPAP